MKFDTLIILLIFFTIAFLLFLAKDYGKEGSFMSTIQKSVGLEVENTDPKPEDTLVAPFAEDGIKPITADERVNLSLPVNKIPLDKPHRSTRHVAEWIVQHVGNALVLDKDKISKLNTEIAPSFTIAALEQYKEFGKTTNIFSAVFHGEETTLASYLRERPLLMSAGNIGGIYEWKYEVVMVLNLVKGHLEQYKSSKAKQQLKDVFFCITIRRDNDANEDGLLIGNWQSGRCRQ